MIDLPPNLPEPVAVSETLLYKCAETAGKHYDVNEFIILSVITVEGGKQWTVSKNKNGTVDLGVMQINSINLDEIKGKFPDITAKDLIEKPCLNIGIGTWLLSKRIKEVGNVWKGVGNYHSRTPKFHQRYLKKINEVYEKVLRKYIPISVTLTERIK